MVGPICYFLTGLNFHPLATINVMVCPPNNRGVLLPPFDPSSACFLHGVENHKFLKAKAAEQRIRQRRREMKRGSVVQKDLNSDFLLIFLNI